MHGTACSARPGTQNAHLDQPAPACPQSKTRPLLLPNLGWATVTYFASIHHVRVMPPAEVIDLAYWPPTLLGQAEVVYGRSMTARTHGHCRGPAVDAFAWNESRAVVCWLA